MKTDLIQVTVHDYGQYSIGHWHIYSDLGQASNTCTFGLLQWASRSSGLEAPDSQAESIPLKTNQKSGDRVRECCVRLSTVPALEGSALGQHRCLARLLRRVKRYGQGPGRGCLQRGLQFGAASEDSRRLSDQEARVLQTSRGAREERKEG